MSEPRKVLVVDDDEVVRLSYQRSLQSANSDFKVEVALNGNDALEALECKPFDVVLLDLRMPGMDGMSVLKAIKRDWPASGVVVITGYPSVESAKEAMRLGAYDYLAKPVSPAEIVNVATGAITQKKWALQPGPRGSDASLPATIDPTS